MNQEEPELTIFEKLISVAIFILIISALYYLLHVIQGCTPFESVLWILIDGMFFVVLVELTFEIPREPHD